jgi:hypothetical protein
MSEISEEPQATGTAAVPPPDPAETATMPAVEEAFEEIDVDEPHVGIIMGSKNDKPKMEPAGKALEEAGIRYEVRVMSAHRDPELVREYCQNARMRGLKVIIAGAGMSAALPGVAAAHSTRCSRRCRCPPGFPSPAWPSTERKTPASSPRG